MFVPPMHRSTTSRAPALRAALLAASALVAAGAAHAQSTPKLGAGGKLDVTVTGFARFLWAVGDVKKKFGGQESSSDFRNDTEVHVVARGKDDNTGL